MLCAFSIKTNAQTITIDSTFTSDVVIHPFGSNDTIYGIGMTGSITLISDTSLVRVIFVDDNYLEYLLYEAYPFIVENWNFNIVNEGEETKYLNETKPNSIYIQLINADLEIASLYLSESYTDFTDSLQVLHKAATESSKINRINTNIEQYGMIWLAGETSVSKLSYTEKKNLFGDKYNLLGMEYYSGGIYDPTPNVYGNMQESDLVPEFDWRNRHGANDPDKIISYYYNDDNGWLTPVKNQMIRDDCEGLCYIYGPLGVAEAVANVYFNQHLQINLSEQQVLDCDGFDGNSQCATDCDCGLSGNTVSMLAVSNGGIVDENCYPIPDPYIHPHSCIGNPINPNHQIRIPGGTEYVSYYPPPTMDEKKQAIIENGPLLTSIGNYSQGQNHSMVLAGYGEIEAGDLLFPNPTNPDTFEIVEENSPYIGQTYWIFKNSWGTDYGDDGYMYHIERDGMFEPEYCKYFVLPVIDEINNYDIDCLDKDNDGYFNWGISEQKPTTCPTCPNDRDSDDSEPNIGPFDEKFYGTPIRPIMEVSCSGTNIDQHGFYTFYEPSQNLSIVFTIENNGNALLNLNPINPVSSTNNAFIIDPNQLPSTNIGMNGGNTTFTINYSHTGGPNVDEAIITIHTLELEYGDFQFMIKNMDCNQQPGPNIIISGIQSWDSWGVIDANVYVDNGAELTITGTYGFIDDVDLNVKPGGRVIIEGGLLTNVCSSTWKGVDVWGNDELSQYPISNQGYLSIINGGTIKNAEQAVQVANASSLTSYAKGTSGGIVKCDSAIFLNNVYDVIIYPYRNINPGTGGEVPNFCTFRNSYFLTDYGAPGSVAHVYLRDVDGIKFRGCTFENKTDFVYNGLNEKVDVGIYSFNSGFYVEDYCTDYYTPCEHTKLSHFNKLRYGIYAINSTASKYISIDTAIFLNNLTGIYMSAVDNQRITSNDISINHYQDFAVAYDDARPVGLYLEACKYYMVEENTFKNKSTVENATGIHILNSGTDANEIYNNSLFNYYTGIMSVGENRDIEGVGLCITCNDFRHCITDVGVKAEIDDSGNPILGSTVGIASSQGEANNIANGPAGNTFTDNPSGNNYDNSTDCGAITYAHHDHFDPPKKIIPSPISSNITLLENDDNTYSKEDACPSNINGGTIPIEMSIVFTEQTEILALEDTLELLIDGGNTESLNLDVQTSFPNEAMQVRQELLSESPYLSDTVIKTAISKEEVLPNAMIRDVLVANPQSAKSNDVLNAIDNRIEPMPEYMMEEILLGQSIWGALDIIVQDVANHKKNWGQAMRMLLHYYKSDTLNPEASLDSMIFLLQNTYCRESQYELARLYLSKYDSISSFEVLNQIENNFNFSASELFVHTLYEDLLALKWQIKQDTTSLDSTQFHGLLTIASHHSCLAGVLARNILLDADLLEYKEPIYFPDNLKSYSNSESPSAAKREDVILNIFPNPAGTFFIMEYDLRNYYGDMVVSICNINGIELDRFILQKFQNQLVVNTGNYSSGVYIIQIKVNEKILESKKVVISK
jgi:hypothetical protein